MPQPPAVIILSKGNGNYLLCGVRLQASLYEHEHIREVIEPRRFMESEIKALIHREMVVVLEASSLYCGDPTRSLRCTQRWDGKVYFVYS